MTVTPCPHGCGGFVDTEKDIAWTMRFLPRKVDDCCNTCRRPLSQCETLTAMERHEPGWCWAWWGPSNHRMRCRLPIEHTGEHDCHETRRSGSIIVATDGELIDPSL